MSNLFLCYKGCTTCTKARKHLEASNVEFENREITVDIPSVEELKTWVKLGNLDIKTLFNTRGQSYRDLNLKETYDTLSDDERLALLSKDGMLIKRPLLITDSKVLVGYKASDYDDIK
ncbi:MAG: Spx/MgsR family RNA polymerase-binding regulatory protein [Alcaligenaceae bacterium]|nr:Spx/MgsR family RNA polymerase-binding regulatory protein [Alcaligenaceae bacterium]NLY62313.1 Spx/MgsR family RNA polymerase-binding regulatory protein [Erysipelothrix sp.]